MKSRIVSIQVLCMLVSGNEMELVSKQPQNLYDIYLILYVQSFRLLMVDGETVRNM